VITQARRVPSLFKETLPPIRYADACRRSSAYHPRPCLSKTRVRATRPLATPPRPAIKQPYPQVAAVKPAELRLHRIGTTRMGVRLYDPALGRFLSVDSVEGGSANDYDYANQDCVNQYDLDGRASVTDRVAVRLNRFYKGMCTGTARRILGATSWTGIFKYSTPAIAGTQFWMRKASTKPAWAAFKASGSGKLLLGLSRAVFWVGAYATVAEVSCRWNDWLGKNSP